MGVPVSNVNFCGMISSSLPESYDNLISTLLASAHSSNKPLTPDALIMHIELEADFRDSKKKSKQQKHGGSALVATESVKSKSKCGDKHEKKPNSQANSTKCDNCGHDGHSKPQCWQKGGGKEGQSPFQLVKKEKE